jgi:O-antigen ligase
VFVLGVPGLVASFTRAGWVAFVGAALTVFFCLIRYQYRASFRRILPGIAVAAVLGSLALVPLAGKIRQRLFEAPPELVTARFETMEMAWDMWKERFWTGAGTNNYMVTLENDFSIFEGDPYYIPVHNMLLLVATELGVIGLAVFLCAGSAAAARFWKVLRSSDPLTQSLAAAVLGALVAIFIEGLFDPIYLTTVTYFTLWFLLGLGAGLSNLTQS